MRPVLSTHVAAAPEQRAALVLGTSIGKNIIGAGVFALCVGSWVAACTVSPGIVTAETVATFDRYPYDGIIFGPGGVCRTTGVRKIARSKYCRYMRANVARFDHFCPWLNQAVGERNYRVFLGFLLCHVR